MKHPPQGMWTTEEIRFNSSGCLEKCTRHETAEFSLTWDETVAIDPTVRLLGHVAAASDNPLDKVPGESRQFLGIMGKEVGCATRAPNVRSQNRPERRNDSPVGTHLPPLRY